MSGHLSPDALLGTVDSPEASGPARAHLQTCDVCRREQEALRNLQAELRIAGRVPEPSPLFWDHFSARIREATGAQAVEPRRWWPLRRWTMVTSVCGALVLTMFVVLRPARPDVSSAVPVASGADAAPVTIADATETWSQVIEMAAEMSSEDLGTLVSGVETTTLLDDLTPQERAVFARLLMAEMERSQ